MSERDANGKIMLPKGRIVIRKGRIGITKGTIGITNGRVGITKSRIEVIIQKRTELFRALRFHGLQKAVCSVSYL